MRCHCDHSVLGHNLATLAYKLLLHSPLPYQVTHWTQTMTTQKPAGVISLPAGAKALPAGV